MTYEIPVCLVETLLADDRGISVGVMYPGEHDPSGTPLIRAAEVDQGRISFSPAFRISPAVHYEYRRTKLEGGECLLTIVGRPGLAALVPNEMAGWNAARAVAVLRLKNVKDGRYFTYAISSPSVQNTIRNWCNTTVQATLNLKEVKKLPIPWPGEKERGRIVSVLSALDDKIDLNCRANKTLEAIARALFQEWFVDFGPVRAKVEGRQPEGLSAEVAALFPDALDEDGKPQGWSNESIYSAVKVIYGAPFASSQFNTTQVGRPLIRIRDLAHENPGVWTPENHPNGYLVQPGDIVVGMDGEFRAYLWGGPEAWLNQRVCVFAPKAGFSAAFVRNAIHAPLAHVEATEVATTVIHLGKNDIDSFKCLIPNPSVSTAFGRACSPLYERIVANKLETRTLISTRDLLLPKLMSGEIRVKDAERLVEQAA